MNPRFNNFWARTGRQYVPAAATDIRQTFLRAVRQQHQPATAQWISVLPYTTEATEPYVKVAK